MIITQRRNDYYSTVLLQSSWRCVILYKMPRPFETLSPKTQLVYEQLRRRSRLTPRVKLAIRLHATGAVKTKSEAAKLAGITPAGFYAVTSPNINNQKVSSLYNGVDELLEDRAIDTSILIERLSQEALRHAGRLMQHAGKEEVQLRACEMLMDRGSKTSKTTNIKVATDGLSSDDAKALASALVQAARVRVANEQAATGDFVRVDDDNPVNVRALLGPPQVR